MGKFLNDASLIKLAGYKTKDSEDSGEESQVDDNLNESNIFDI